LLFHKFLKDLDSVRNEVERLIAKQKLGSPYDLSPFKDKIEELLDSISEFNRDWNKSQVVFRIARIVKSSTTQRDDLSANCANNTDSEGVITYQENIVLPDAKHDLESHIEKEKLHFEYPRFKRR
jgi:hypothetical protein